MAERRRTRPRSLWWTATALLLVALTGFALGLVAGVAWEEPALVARHLLGRTTAVAWRTPAGGEVAEAVSEPLPDVAALSEPTPEPPAPVRAVPTPEPPAPVRAVPTPEPPAPVRAAPSATRLRPEVLTPGGASGRFAVQVGAFAESGTAERLAVSLRAKGYDVYVSPGAGAGDARWRVRVGPHAAREDAERAARRLKAEEKLPTWVLDEEGAG